MGEDAIPRAGGLRMSTEVTSTDQQAVTSDLVMPEEAEQPREVIDVTPQASSESDNDQQGRLFDQQVEIIEGELIKEGHAAGAELGIDYVELPPGSHARFVPAPSEASHPDEVDPDKDLPFDPEERDEWGYAESDGWQAEQTAEPDDDYTIGAPESAVIAASGAALYQDLVAPYKPSIWERIAPWSDYNIRRRTAERIDALDAQQAARVMRVGNEFERSLAARKLGLYGGQQQRDKAEAAQPTKPAGEGINVQIVTGHEGAAAHG
jgi:hypothetical protein